MYLDTSVIIKLLVREADSAVFDKYVSGKPLTTSELAWTEVFSALLHKERARQIGRDDRLNAWTTFCQWVDSEQIALHPLDGTVLKKARHVMDHCHPDVPLRALDAIHTASCDLSQDFPLCTTDRRMRDAAGVLGIPVFPEANPS
jgi:predicted nucleic acid-binding protein